MNRLIITSELYDFIVFDVESETITFKKPKTDLLQCDHFHNKHRNPFRPFGIAEDDDSLYITSNDRLGKFDKFTYEFLNLIDIPLWMNTHQIIKDGNTLYICNTAIDSIGIYNLETKENKQLNLNYMSVFNQVLVPAFADQLDIRHINCMHDAGDKIYFIRHNRDLTESDFGYFDKRTLEPVLFISVGRCCHGIKIINNELISLSTATGELISINLTSLKVTKAPLVDPDTTFLRGLEYLDGELYIGGSINFKKTLEINPECFILKLNLESGVSKKIVLENTKFINDLKFIT